MYKELTNQTHMTSLLCPSRRPHYPTATLSLSRFPNTTNATVTPLAHTWLAPTNTTTPTTITMYCRRCSSLLVLLAVVCVAVCEKAAKAPEKSPRAKAPAPAPVEAPQLTTNGTLDPSQEKALQALGVSLESSDPCNTDVQQTVICDTATPKRHVVSLQLHLCHPNTTLPSTALASLSTLNTLSFLDCPARPGPLPPALAKTLKSLSIVRSLGKTALHPDLPDLLPAFALACKSLTSLTITDTSLANVTLQSLLRSLPDLDSLVLTNTNISGPLPKSFPPTLTTLQLNNNKIRSALPPGLWNVSSLRYLDLSNNKLQGGIPKGKGMDELVYLDLSHNELNGTVPAFVGAIKSLRYVDMSNNKLKGVLPFTTVFVKRLNTFKVGGNKMVCYNSSMLVSFIAGGAEPCDAKGKPDAGSAAPSESSDDMAPSPEPSAEDEEASGHHRHKNGPKTVVVAIAIALASVFVVIILAIVLSKCCSRRRRR